LELVFFKNLEPI